MFGRCIFEVVHADVIIDVGLCVVEIVVFFDELQIGLYVVVVPGQIV